LSRSPLGLGLAAVVLLAGPAAAHTTLVGSTPARGAVLSAGPDALVLEFSAAPRPGLAAVVVHGPDGRPAGELRGAAAVDGSTLRQALGAPLPPGDWTASYRVVAADGHPVTGAVAFRVDGTPGSPAPAQAPRVAAGQTSSAAALAPGGLAAALLVAAGLAGARRLRSRRG
jgi:copper resistance protein C